MEKKNPNLSILPNWQQRLQPSCLTDTPSFRGGGVVCFVLAYVIDIGATAHLNFRYLTQNLLHQSPKMHCALKTSSACAGNFSRSLARGLVAPEPDLLSLNGTFGLGWVHSHIVASLILPLPSFSLSTNLATFSLGRNSASSSAGPLLYARGYSRTVR